MNGATPSGPMAWMTRSANDSTTACAGTGQAREARHEPQREPAREVLRADADGDRGDDAPGHERRRLAPGGEQPDDEIPRVGERVRPEEDPGEADDLERDEAMPRPPAARPRALDEARPAAPPALDDERGAVDPAPDDERPAGAVPEAADEHRQHEVAIREQRPAAVAAERDVEVVAEPARERHVPAPPEVRDRRRGVGRVEVLREREPEEERDPDRDVRVAEEVGVDLHRVGVDARRAPRATSAGSAPRTPGRRCSPRGGWRSRPS